MGPGVDQDRRNDWIWFGSLWAIFSAIGFYLVLGIDLLPAQWAHEAEIVDDAYILLMGLSIPIFAGVAAALLTSLLRFRVQVDDIPTEDGPPVHNNRNFVRLWVASTLILALMITVNPGFIGIAELRGEPSADIVVEVQAQRWSWKVNYENGAETFNQLYLPADRRVRFDITSLDLVHSFWIPGFRVKIDAVPGRVTYLYVTPEGVGSFEDDFNLRVQCAEICGLGHAQMAMPVTVLAPADFDTWVSDLAEGA